MADPYPKTKQLARGYKRYRRKVASAKEWQKIRAEKYTSCRLASSGCSGILELHHVISRAQGGDDVADNVVPICTGHHFYVTERNPAALRFLAENLLDSEYAYVVGKLGENALARLFGV